MKNIAIFASGSGTNAENIIKFFQDHPAGRVQLVLSNNADAYVLERARKLGVPAVTFSRQELMEGKVLEELRKSQIDLVVLAGFLWLVPGDLVSAFPGRMINIHPALLPKYGGKGMYGDRVHIAVKDSGDRESGITIHLVNEKYDEGDILLQAYCAVNPEDTPEDIAKKVHALEYQYYPKVIESMLKNL